MGWIITSKSSAFNIFAQSMGFIRHLQILIGRDVCRGSKVSFCPSVPARAIERRNQSNRSFTSFPCQNCGDEGALRPHCGGTTQKLSESACGKYTPSVWNFSCDFLWINYLINWHMLQSYIYCTADDLKPGSMPQLFASELGCHSSTNRLHLSLWCSNEPRSRRMMDHLL